MKTPLLAFLIVVLMAQLAGAQSFSQLSNKRGDNPFLYNNFELFIRRTQVSGKYTESFGGTTFNFRYRYDNYEKGRGRIHYENPTLGDFLFVVGRLLKGDDVTVRSTEQSFGAGFLGWMQAYGNVVATDKFLFSAGASFGDYIFGSRRATPPPGSSQTLLPPEGYFVHLGPAVRASYVIGNAFWIDAYLHPDFGFRATGPSTDAAGGRYPRPIFLNIGTDFHHATTRLFFSYRYNHLIDRGENKDAATRMDFSFGYSFGKP